MGTAVGIRTAVKLASPPGSARQHRALLVRGCERETQHGPRAFGAGRAGRLKQVTCRSCSGARTTDWDLRAHSQRVGRGELSPQPALQVFFRTKPRHRRGDRVVRRRPWTGAGSTRGPFSCTSKSCGCWDTPEPTWSLEYRQPRGDRSHGGSGSRAALGSIVLETGLATAIRAPRVLRGAAPGVHTAAERAVGRPG